MKKVIIFILLFCVLGLFFYIYYDKNPKEENIPEKIVFEKLENQRIVFLGDSLMKGYTTDNGGIAARLEKIMPNNYFMDYSRIGSTISINTVTEEIGDDIAIINQAKKAVEDEPNIVILNGGVNDIIGYVRGYLELNKELEAGYVNNIQDIDDETVLGDFKKTIDFLKNSFPEAKLIYVQMYNLDQDVLNGLAKSKDEKEILKLKYDAILNGIELICLKNDVLYVDVSEFLKDTNLEYRQEDYIHFKDLAYERIMEELIFKLNELY